MKTSGSRLRAPRPMRRGGLTAIAVAAGVAAVALTPPAHALDTAGHEIMVWGGNTQGELGDGATENVLTPKLVKPGGLDFTQISVTPALATVGLTGDGRAYGWGWNASGFFGDGTQGQTSSIPVATTMPEGVAFTDIASGSSAVLAVDGDGRVWGWGQNTFGIFGEGDAFEYFLTPTLIPFPDGVRISRVLASYAAAYAVDTDGRVWGWGNNLNGQLALPDTEVRITAPTLVPVPDGFAAAQIWVGGNTVLATDPDGHLWGWGGNDVAQLAISTSTDAEGRNVPNAVYAVTRLEAIGEEVATASVAGGDHTLAVLGDGTAVAWGANGVGQLGTGATSGFETGPQQVVVPAGVQFVDADAPVLASLAIAGDGRIYSWGSNVSGALGDGTTNARLVPGPVALPDDVRALGIEGPVGGIFAAVDVGPVITTEQLPRSTHGEPYATRIEATGTAPISFRVGRGALPAGLELDAATGEIRGTPRPDARTSTFTVEATNVVGTSSREFTIVVALPATGAEPPWLILGVGVSLLMLGGLLLVMVRHRHPSR